MSDLIYRHDALEAMSRISDSICEAEAVDALCELPEVDAVPVRHGEWLPGNLSMGAYWVCSNCGFPSEAQGAFKIYKYCPNCGANMKGENNG